MKCYNNGNFMDRGSTKIDITEKEAETIVEKINHTDDPAAEYNIEVLKRMKSAQRSLFEHVATRIENSDNPDAHAFGAAMAYDAFDKRVGLTAGKIDISDDDIVDYYAQLFVNSNKAHLINNPQQLVKELKSGGNIVSNTNWFNDILYKVCPHFMELVGVYYKPLKRFGRGGEFLNGVHDVAIVILLKTGRTK